MCLHSPFLVRKTTRRRSYGVSDGNTIFLQAVCDHSRFPSATRCDPYSLSCLLGTYHDSPVLSMLLLDPIGTAGVIYGQSTCTENRPSQRLDLVLRSSDNACRSPWPILLHHKHRQTSRRLESCRFGVREHIASGFEILRVQHSRTQAASKEYPTACPRRNSVCSTSGK